MGKTSLANTLETFLKSPTKSPKSWSWLSENHPELLCTQVMQLYDGLSINNNEELAVEDHAKNVKLVKLKTVHIKVSKRKQLKRILPSWLTGIDAEVSIPTSKVQVKLVDLGGHTAMVLVTVSFDLFGIPVKILCVHSGTPKRKQVYFPIRGSLT